MGWLSGRLRFSALLCVQRWGVKHQCKWRTLAVIRRNVRFTHAPAEWRETFAEAQVPYDKILGYAKFGAVWAASRREKSGDAVHGITKFS